MLAHPFCRKRFQAWRRLRYQSRQGSDLVLYNIAEINIELTAEKNELRFIVKNQLTKTQPETKDKTLRISG